MRSFENFIASFFNMIKIIFLMTIHIEKKNNNTYRYYELFYYRFKNNIHETRTIKL